MIAVTITTKLALSSAIYLGFKVPQHLVEDKEVVPFPLRCSERAVDDAKDDCVVAIFTMT